MQFVDLSGQKFGSIEIISLDRITTRSYWNCQCECGSVRVLRIDVAKNGSKCKECSVKGILKKTGKFICSQCGDSIKAKKSSLKRRIEQRDYYCSPCRYEYRKKRHRERMVSDPVYAEKDRVKNLIYYYLNNGGKDQCEAEQYLGLKCQEFKDYIAADFSDPSMKWQKYGSFHLDHIRPLALAKTNEEIKKAWHYSNLQPLTPKENMEKGSKLDWRQKDVDKE